MRIMIRDFCRNGIYAKNLCFEYNRLPPFQKKERAAILKRILGNTSETLLIEQPFYCDYGYNIEIGSNFYANMNCIILDEAKVSFGNNVFIAPGCGFYTAGNPCKVIRVITEEDKQKYK